MGLEKGEVEIGSRIQKLNSTHTLVSPTPTTLEGYLLEFESSMSVSFVSEYSRKDASADRGRLTGWKAQLHSSHDICAITYYDLFLYCSAGL